MQYDKGYEHRVAVSNLKPGDKVRAPEFYDATGTHGDMVEYEVEQVFPSNDVTDPQYNVRAVIAREDAAGKRHCHFMTHHNLEIV